MRYLTLLGTALPVLAWGQGMMDRQFIVTPHANRKVFLGRTPPEGQKLMNYALDRLEQAKVLLICRADGSFTFRFEDGYGPDHFAIAGSWKQVADGLQLAPDSVTGKMTIHHLVRAAGADLSEERMLGVPAGISATYRLKK